MRRTTFALAFAVLAGVAAELQAGPINFTASTVLQAGGTQKTNDSGAVFASTSDMISNPTTGDGGLASATAGGNSFLGILKAKAAAGSGGGSVLGGAQATWMDSSMLKFVGTKTPAPVLLFNFSIQGTLGQSAGGLLSPASSAVTITVTTPSGSVIGTVQLTQTAMSNQITPNGVLNFQSTLTDHVIAQDYQFSGNLLAAIPLESQGLGFAQYGPFDATLAASVQVDTYGAASADVSHSISLVSVTLPDGNTPESEGYTLSFESGLGSPNGNVPVAVPEPATLSLAGIGSLCLIGYAWRRHRRIDANE
jgi:hypothetical protein